MQNPHCKARSCKLSSTNTQLLLLLHSGQLGEGVVHIRVIIVSMTDDNKAQTIWLFAPKLDHCHLIIALAPSLASTQQSAQVVSSNLDCCGGDFFRRSTVLVNLSHEPRQMANSSMFLSRHSSSL